jgi:hypothetical protein
VDSPIEVGTATYRLRHRHAVKTGEGEKLPLRPPCQSCRRGEQAPARWPAAFRDATTAKRTAAADLRNARLDVEVTDVPVPEAQRHCPSCKDKELRRVGAGKVSSVIEYVRPHFRRRVFRRETLSCKNFLFVGIAQCEIADAIELAASAIRLLSRRPHRLRR